MILKTKILKDLKQYIINFKGLKAGQHHFRFEIDDQFFVHFDKSEIQRGSLTAEVTLTKSGKTLTFSFFIEGEVEVQCDRCLDYFYMPLQCHEELFVEFGARNSDITDVDKVLTLAYTETEINLTQHLYEYIHLNLPYRRIHPESSEGVSQCNEEMLNRLSAMELSENEEKIDPRWEKLKSILN